MIRQPARDLKLVADNPSPQAVNHFTRLDQIDLLIEAQEADPEVGFMSRLLMLCTLPRTNLDPQREYVRENGPFMLSLVAGPKTGLPYGSLPRLLLAWVATEAVRTRSRELFLGPSLSDFMRGIGLIPEGGGPTGGRTRLQDQMVRLFKCAVSLEYRDKRREAAVSSLITDKRHFWWDPKQPNSPTLWNCTIRLGEELYNEIRRRPIPFDTHILSALKRSSLGLDLYWWLTYRTFALDHSLKLSWKMLHQQLAFDPTKTTNKLAVNAFRTDCLRELFKIKQAWPGLRFSTPTGCLELRPSRPAIPPKE